MDRCAYYFIDDVVLLPLPAAGKSQDVACGQTVRLGTCALPATSGATYQWSPATGLSDPTSPNPTFVASPLGPLTYTLTVSIPRPYQQPLTVQTSVTFSIQGGGAPVAVAAATGTRLCKGSRVLLTATGGDGVNYTWSPALGLSSTTGAQVFASPDSDITYTVSSGCGTAADIALEVQEDCCPYDFYLNSGIEVRELDNASAHIYTSSPFDPKVLIYHANGDLRLEADTYTLPPGGVLLLDDDATVTVANHAELVVDQATLTAASCEDMWQAVRVLADARGIRTTGTASAPAQVEQSWEGIVLEEPDANQPTPTFQFTHTNFLNNRQSLAFYRDATAALPGDAITHCRFDSDPAAFKGPWNNPAPEQQHYAERHILLAGQLLPATVEHNDFRHCYYGIYTPERDVTYNSIRVFESTFSDFYLAGIHSNRGAGQVPQEYQVENCTFTFPAGATLPSTEQTNDLLPSLYFSTVHVAQPVVPATFGIHFGDNSPVLTALGNRFQQLDSTSVAMDNYDKFGTVRPPQTGIYCVVPRTLDGNTFYLLDKGIHLQYAQDFGRTWTPLAAVSIRGNGFVHCREGLGIFPASIKLGNGITNDLTLRLTCNTFRRDAQREGTTLGVHQYAAPNNGGVASYLPTVRLDDPSNNASPSLLKNCFDNQGGTVNGQYFALVNDQGGPQLVYETFGSSSTNANVNKAVYIANLSIGNLLIPTNNGPLTQNPIPLPQTPTGYEPCFQDRIPNAGLQQRGTNGSTGATTLPDSKTNALSVGYPNPTSGRITFAYQLKAANLKAELLVRRAVDGREVQRVALNGEAKEHTLNLTDQPASTYFVTLLVNQVPVSTRRVVVSQTEHP